MKASHYLAGLLCLLPAHAEFTPLFQIGTVGDGPDGFGDVDTVTDFGNGSPTAKDDHFYLPSEDVGNFERALRSDDPVNVIHFPLTGAQRSPNSVMRFRVHFGWGDRWDIDDPASTVVSFSLNGNPASYTTPTFERTEIYSFEVPANSPLLQTGANTLTLTRTGTPSSYVDFDVVLIELDPTGILDTDNDGATDAWEIRTGFDPASNVSTPPIWPGAIGINFRTSAEGENPEWPRGTPNGMIPQINWNQTKPLRQWISDESPLLSKTREVISSPEAGLIVNSAGITTNVTLNFTHNGVYTTHAKGSRERDLLNSYLHNREGSPSSVTLGNIPFSSYDLYVYFAGSWQGASGVITAGGESVTVRAITHPVEPGFISYRPSTTEYSSRANVVKFSSLSGPSQTISMARLVSNTGICAVQIVDNSLDSNNNSIPDYWDLAYGSQNASDGDGSLSSMNSSKVPTLGFPILMATA